VTAGHGVTTMLKTNSNNLPLRAMTAKLKTQNYILELYAGKSTISNFCSLFCFSVGETKNKQHLTMIVPRTRLSTIDDRSFRVTVARAWNSLPINVTASTSLPSFERQLKTFLFTKSFPSL